MDEAALFTLLDNMGIRNLKRRGGNIGGSCPSGLHEDNNPSWGISLKEPHLYGCFSCGFKGSIQSLLVIVGKYNPVQAKIICGSLDEKPQVDASALRRALEPKKQKLEVFSADEMYPYALSKRAVTYFESRGIARETLIAARVGFDKREQRVLFPWWIGRKLVAIAGRYIGDKPDMPKIRNYLLGENKRRSVYLPTGVLGPSELIIVEGETDALKVYQSGFENVAAIGSAELSRDQIALMVESGAEGYCIFTDDDISGRHIAFLLNKALSEIAPTRIVDYEPVRMRMRDSVGKLDAGMLSENQIRLLVEKRKGARIFPKLGQH